ncbi:sigma-70 family RNA polymerase sigma factor [Sinomonas atrocyanea]|uniref:sigma-70 family RNA polymerase sigma factor n=1 Tax=Sinomonas atrocyanea TaxID=37927 RepID=UPI002863416F|nr:sigma-70 family RNA polymerase sigma factor [Sinomonas atrocyanea]MDR6622058.1 RNA polymerase sigma-B factor [Sinomonas atrocyanea]
MQEAPRETHLLPAPNDPGLAGSSDSVNGVVPGAAPEGRARRSEPPTDGTDPVAAGQLAIEYLGVADALARRFRCAGHDTEDLRQVARLGLLKAAHRYREPLGHGFVPYAVPTITGELKRYLRDQSWVVRPPRALQELRLKVNALRPGLAQELGHDPTTAELSMAAGVPASDVAEAQIAESAMVGQPVEHGDSSEDPEERRLNVVLGAEDPGYEHVEQMHALAGAMSDATDNDKRLLDLRFVQEMTQDQIAKELGVSQMQVSRLLKRLLDRLRRRMAA